MILSKAFRGSGEVEGTVSSIHYMPKGLAISAPVDYLLALCASPGKRKQYQAAAVPSSAATIEPCTVWLGNRFGFLK